MTVTYVPTEDRMMLRIATSEKTEYRLWLTRRFIATLWPALGGQLAQTADLSGLRPQSNDADGPAGASEPPAAAVPPKVRDAVLGMEHQAAVQESDFSRKHDEDTVDLTANTGPMVVTGAKVKPWDGKKLVLGFQTSNDMNVTVTLDKKLLHGFCHMVATTVQKAGWGLALTVGEPVVTPQAGTKVIH
ncbi:MAG: hypothetical protein CMM77_05565 [Rhodospirillaceae bacterium]|nr:hypothetical protein [Rhodospirillaceae bacterium]